MTPERWQQIQGVFHQLTAQPAECRAELLDELCTGDSELRAEVEALLAADAAVSSVLDTSPAGLSEVLAEVTRFPLGDARIGPYHVLRELGRGGMGVVYLAEREDVGSRVALKLVRGGAAAPEHVARFLVERRLLARLQHPHIAHLLDAGVMDDGTPWFAMEYVEGEAIDRFCDARRLGIRERLALFEAVCEAVQYAHRNLVVHRDLKPSNILIAADGTPKLLDFGIAKLLVGSEEEAPRLTGTGLRLMTPEYAAPEQIRGEPVTTATDVYALGVVLYELLCGHPPYRVHGHSLAEIERMVLEHDPPRPSSVVRRTKEVRHGDGAVERITPQAVAEARGTLAERLRRELVGDLDTIVLRALDKDPARRYPSAEALLEDLRRRRQGLPVLARPQTRAYRTRKFVLRHRLGVAAGVVLTALLLAFGAMMTVQQHATARERDRAAAEAARARQATEFLVGLFRASQPGEARGDTVTARELLERGVARAESLQDTPDLQAQMLSTIGRVYRTLGRFDRARPLLERALAIQRSLAAGRPDEQLARTQATLGALLLQTGEYEPAIGLLREALAAQRALFGPRHADIGDVLATLGVAEQLAGHPVAAESVYREAVTVLSATIGDADPKTLLAMSNLATLLGNDGRYAEAEPVFRSLLDRQRAALGRWHPYVANLSSHLGEVRYEQGDYVAADSFQREAVRVRERVLDPDHPDLAFALILLAKVRLATGDAAEADSLTARALAIQRRQLTEDHEESLIGLAARAGALFERGDAVAAESLARRAVALGRAELPADHPYRVILLNRLATVLRDRGQVDEAESLYREALDVAAHVLPPTHPDRARALGGYGGLLAITGRAAEAESVLREALALHHTRLPDGDWQIAELESYLGGALMTLGRHAEAEPLLVRSEAALRAAHGPQARLAREAQARLTALRAGS